MRFNNIDKREEWIKYFLGKYVKRLSLNEYGRILIGYNLKENVIIIETSEGKYLVSNLIEKGLYNISIKYKDFVYAEKRSFEDIMKINPLNK